MSNLLAWVNSFYLLLQCRVGVKLELRLTNIDHRLLISQLSSFILVDSDRFQPIIKRIRSWDVTGDCFVFRASGFSISTERTANKRLVERPDKLLARKIDTSSKIEKAQKEKQKYERKRLWKKKKRSCANLGSHKTEAQKCCSKIVGTLTNFSYCSYFSYSSFLERHKICLIYF